MRLFRQVLRVFCTICELFKIRWVYSIWLFVMFLDVTRLCRDFYFSFIFDFEELPFGSFGLKGVVFSICSSSWHSSSSNGALLCAVFRSVKETGFLT